MVDSQWSEFLPRHRPDVKYRQQQSEDNESDDPADDQNKKWL